MKSVVGGAAVRQVAFVGPFGVGKTTAVCTVAEGTVATTDVASTAMMLRGGGRHLKTTTTVGLEIGRWSAPDGTTVSVVGTPGQERFDVVRKSAMPRSQGVVLWLYGHHEHALLDAELWLEFIAQEVPTSRLTVVLTRLEETGPGLAEFREVVDKVDPDIPVLAADPRDSGDVTKVLSTALRIPDEGAA